MPSDQDIKTCWNRTGVVVILVILFLIALGTRLVDLDADPPAYFADGSQGLTTDAAHLTWHARNKVLFGTWGVLGYEYWTAFKISIVSGLSFLLFSLFGVSRYTANLAGVLLNLTGLLLFVVALRKQAGDRAAVIAAVFLAFNYGLSLYGRLPFLENGLIFLGSLVYLVYAYSADRLAGQITLGVLVGLCGLFGKSFGFLLGIGPLVYLVTGNRKRRWSALGAFLGSTIACFCSGSWGRWPF